VTVELPALSSTDFTTRLRAAISVELGESAFRALFIHYEELRRWAPKVDLIGPGAVGELIERHYAESLAALPWLPVGPFRLADVGSGAGFPGAILAAARPDAEVSLIEPRERRAAFLLAVVRKARLGAQVVAARVDGSSSALLPNGIHVATTRAVRLDSSLLRALAPHLAPDGVVLAWTGGETPELPPGFAPGRSMLLPGSRDRHLREIRSSGARA